MKQKHKKSKPIFVIMMFSIGILVVIECLLLVGTLLGGGVTTNLNDNETKILHERVLNRKNYLENEMVTRWSNVDLTIQTINNKTQILLDSGELSLESMDASSDSCKSLLEDTTSDLIALMRKNSVTGAFIVINTHNIDSVPSKNKPGIYFRDLDPISNPSSKNSDLLIERGSIEITQATAFTTDIGWMPTYNFSENGYDKFFYEPFMAAYNSKEKLSSENFGYWSGAHKLDGDVKEIISYSVPLILNDGTVYGVLGIDLTTDYINSLLPHQEIMGNNSGSYSLIRSTENSDTYENITVSGSMYLQDVGKETKIKLIPQDKNIYKIEATSIEENVLCSSEKITLYNSNTMFSDEKWSLIGSVRHNDLFAFPNHLTMMLVISIFITLFFGILGTIVMCIIVTRPVSSLVTELETASLTENLNLKNTGILEIDKLASSIESLSHNVMNSATKFSQILKMASINIAGFEIDHEDSTFFVTDTFFELFGRNDIDVKSLKLNHFTNFLKDLQRYVFEEKENEIIYKIPLNDDYIYISLNYHDEVDRSIGLAEDITKEILETKLLEYERDHDILTALINRRAFYKILNKLFKDKTNTLKTAAMVMIDLDNLKAINDTYGHDYGDKYINSAAKCFIGSTPKETIITRVSGDEFYLFFYGYNNKGEIIELINKLKVSIDLWSVTISNTKLCKLSVSGGITWYPDDAQNYDLLLKYSDFAMYSAKRAGKGNFSYYDNNDFLHEKSIINDKSELIDIIENNKVYYCFQPIVSIKTGKIYAYEALMRSNAPTLNTPNKILTTAKLESKLNNIEELTWFNALSAYSKNIKDRSIEKECKIFINSISNQSLSVEKIEEIETLYSKYLSNIVVEITEEERLKADAHEFKIKYLNSWNAAIALDDYGSGYNGGKSLLYINPKYVKLDLELIRDIDSDMDKQKIVQHMISYSHNRNMLIVAEGIETELELLTIAQLGADFVQGFFIALPCENPPKITENAKICIDNIIKNKKDKI